MNTACPGLDSDGRLEDAVRQVNVALVRSLLLEAVDPNARNQVLCPHCLGLVRRIEHLGAEWQYCSAHGMSQAKSRASFDHRLVDRVWS